MAFRWKRALTSAAVAAGLAAGSASADPRLLTARTPQGGGLVEHAISVDFDDGLSRSGFIDISFSGSFDAATTIDLAEWPDIQESMETTTVVELRGGTGGGSAVDVVPVARLVVPEGQPVSYSAVVSRAGQNFVLVPEPLASLCAAWALTTLAWLRRRSRRGEGAG